MMQRKLLIGMAFLGCATYLIAICIYKGASLVELSTTIGAMSAGIGMLMWGYKAEYDKKKEG